MKLRLRKLIIVFSTVSAAALTLVALLLLASTTSATAGAPRAIPGADSVGWVLTTNISDGNISLVNGTTQAVIGPFLDGELGSAGGGVIEAAITPDGNKALISNFGDSAIYFVDISNPSEPKLDTTGPVSAALSMFAEDIAITHDGRYALVSDGGFSNLIVTLDVLSHTPVYTLDLSVISPTLYAQAVDIAPDGTVIFVDYWQRTIGSALLDESGQLTFTGAYTYSVGGVLPAPVNVYVAPDDHTIIVCNAFTTTLGVFEIQAPGVISFTDVVTGLSHEITTTSSPAVQSLAFNSINNHFYAMVNGRIDELGDRAPDQVAVLALVGPGDVQLVQPSAADLPHATASQFFGVDTAAVLGPNLYVGYPNSNSFSIGDPPYALAKVDLLTMDATPIYLGGLPTSVAVVPPRRVFLPLTQR